MECECGRVTGVKCGWSGPAVETVLVEHMPEHLRASHEAAGNRGVYPHNGAVRLRVARSCVADVVDGEWTTEVGNPACGAPAVSFGRPILCDLEAGHTGQHALTEDGQTYRWGKRRP